jgi:hypothetical protein
MILIIEKRRRNSSSKNLEITIYDEEDMSISGGKQ